MPLLQDNARGGGGPNEMPSRACRSFAEFLELDKTFSEPVGAPAVSRNDCGDYWSWESPESPEVAQTPRSRVPSGCFPPHHPRAFASYSESAQPGSMWNGNEENCNGNDSRTRDLVSSLKALALPGRAGPDLATLSPPLPPTSFDTSMSTWQSEQCNLQLREESRASVLARRASFCGVVSNGGNGGTSLRWCGKLPARDPEPGGGFSQKLFMGGLPWDITETALMHALRHFQPLRVEWPGRETGGSPRGFAYVTLESERRVRALLAACRRDGNDWKYRLHSRKIRTKEVQVIPWAVCDANWVSMGSARLEAARTVFVGALHGMLSASALASIMNDLFSGVVYAGIDTDKNKYPIGSGRVTFNNVHSYVRAISAAYIEIQTDKFTKKVQVDPYLEDSMCSVCKLQQGPYFCRKPACFGYFCRSCWSWQHATEEHKPLMRNSKCVPPSVPHLAHTASPPRLTNGHPHHPAPARLTPPETDLYNGVYAQPREGTLSPSTSGSGRGSDAAGAEAEAGTGADKRGEPPGDWSLH